MWLWNTRTFSKWALFKPRISLSKLKESKYRIDISDSFTIKAASLRKVFPVIAEFPCHFLQSPVWRNVLWTHHQMGRDRHYTWNRCSVLGYWSLLLSFLSKMFKGQAGLQGNYEWKTPILQHPWKTLKICDTVCTLHHSFQCMVTTFCQNKANNSNFDFHCCTV